jgi:hypothetical protein
LQVGLKLRLQHRELRHLKDWRRCATGRSGDCRAVRNHAQRAVRSRGRLTRFGVVPVYRLHETEADHHQNENRRHPFLGKRATGVEEWFHQATTATSLSKLDARRDAREAKSADFAGKMIARQGLNHDLRHCAITQLAEGGTSDATIMAIAAQVSADE